eukprot:3793-Pelagococcus_subviridis.AAC.2
MGTGARRTRLRRRRAVVVHRAHVRAPREQPPRDPQVVIRARDVQRRVVELADRVDVGAVR